MEPTNVVGSYSVPEWLERLKTEYYQRRISAQHMAEINEVAIKAAVKDQELAGIDIVSDGELRRDNDVDYFLARVYGPGSGRRLPLHPAADPKADQVLLHRAVLAVPADPRRRLLRAGRPGPRAGPPAQRRSPRAGQGRGRTPPDRRAVPGRLPGSGRAGDRGGEHRHRRRTRHLGAARVLRQPLRAAVLGGALRLPVPGGQGCPGGPGRPGVRPQGPGRPAADPAARLGQMAGPGGHRRQEPRGRGGRAGRVPDQARAGVRTGRPPDDQPRLRAAPPRARRGPAEAARHGGGRRPGPSRATRRTDIMSTEDGFLFTSESVTEGHPDKVADQISDAIVDAALAADPQSRVAVETLLTTGLVVLAGEITTKAVLDFAAIAREVICDIGYDTGDFGFDGNAVGVITALDRQSPDIARGVDESHDT